MSPRAAALVAGLVAAAWIASRDLASIPLPSAYTGYQPSDPLAAQLIEPVLHAPWVGAVPWIFAGLLAVCVVTQAWLLSIAYGATSVAAMAVVAAMVLSHSWAASVRHGGSLAIALAFSWLAWMFILRAGPGGPDNAAPSEAQPDPPSLLGGLRRSLARLRRSGHGGREGGWLTCAGLLSWIAAIASSWLALVSAPMLLAGLTIGEQRKRVRMGLVALGAVAGLTGLALYCVRIATIAAPLSAEGAPEVSAFGVLNVLFDPAYRGRARSGASLSITHALTIGLAAVGVAGAATRRRWRGGLVVSALCAAGIAMVWPLWRTAVGDLVVWLAAPFVAVGLAIVARTVASAREAVATAIGGLLLCAATVSDRSASYARDRSQAQLLQPVLGSLAVDSAVFAVEDVDVDAAIVAAHGERTAGWRIAQDPAQVGELVDAGRTVLAGPVARRHLELAGFRFLGLTPRDDADGFRVSRIADRLNCAVVRTDRWSLLPGVEYTGRLGVEIPGEPGAGMTFIIGADDGPPRPAVSDMSGAELLLKVEPLLTAPSVEAPPPDYWLESGDPARAPAHVVRVVLPAHPASPTLLDFALGRRAPRVIARLTGFDDAARGRVCAAPLSAPEIWGDPEASPEAVVPLEASTMLTMGWFGVEEQARGGPFRWTERVAVVLIPSARRAAVRIVLDAEPGASTGDPPTLGLIVNGIEQRALVMRSGADRYEWILPPPAWLAGTNELVFTVSKVLRPADVGGQDTRALGMKVTRLAITREEHENTKITKKFNGKTIQ